MDVSYPFGVRKGSWSEEEDRLLKKCIEKYGEGKWHQVPFRSGLNRCRKSCRLRWLNYLKPDIKRGSFSADEVDLMLRLHNLLGNRWSIIARRLPGRTSNDVKNYWNTHMQKKITCSRIGGSKTEKKDMQVNIIKPQPRTFSKELVKNKTSTIIKNIIPARGNLFHAPPPQRTLTAPLGDKNSNPFHGTTSSSVDGDVQDQLPRWDSMVLDMEMDNGNTWWSFDETNMGNSVNMPGIKATEGNSFLDSPTRDWVDNFMEDNLEIWNNFGDEQIVI